MSRTRSSEAFATAQKFMPGGVNSPVRSFRNVDTTPPFIAKGKGSHIFDVDGNEYIDYVLSWGPLILGHADADVVAAIREQAQYGTSYGAPTELETEIAQKVQTFFPAIEMIRLVSSGTEATMSALRLARGYTGRDKIVKFVGCYHGHSDGLLVKAGSGAATMGVPDSPGIPSEIAADTLTLPYNNPDAVKELFAQYGDEIAAVIVEGVAGNMGCVLPQPGYLQLLRELTQKAGALLIVDEVMSGFRAAAGGACEYFDITPDLICLGKVIGGGLPVGAFGGKREVMEKLAPQGPVYQAGTLSGNPLAVTAGLATMNKLSADRFTELAAKTETLCQGLEAAAKDAGVPIIVHRIGSMFTVFFNEHEVTDYDTVATSHLDEFNVYFLAMLEAGVYLAPSQFECGFMSLAHTDEDIRQTLAAARKAFQKVAAFREHKGRN